METDPRTIQLPDGAVAVVRRVTPADRDRLRTAFHELSDRTRFLRFGSVSPDLTPSQLRYLTDLDHADHAAWIALDRESAQGPTMGVARYVRSSDDPTVAEAAITVVDRYQRRGVGSALLLVLEGTAAEHGVEVFRSYVLAENEPMLHLFDELGADRERIDERLWQVDVPVRVDHDGPQEPPTRAVLLAAAKRVLPPLVSALPPVWAWRKLREDRSP